MKKILFATDFSESAKIAFKYAYKLSKESDAELIIAHVFDLPSLISNPDDANLLDEVLNATQKDFETKLLALAKEELGSDYDEKKIRPFAVQDPLSVQGILEIEEKTGPDLIVVGTTGNSRLKKIFLGSTSAGLIKSAKCPVLVVPEGSKYSKPDQILYASDLQESDIDAISALSEIAELFSSEIRVLHVFPGHKDDNQDILQAFTNQLKKKVSYEKIKVDSIISFDIFETLNNYVVLNKIGMISMLERKHEGIFDNFFQRDKVIKMEEVINVPILSFNENAFIEKATLEKAK